MFQVCLRIKWHKFTELYWQTLATIGSWPTSLCQKYILYIGQMRLDGGRGSSLSIVSGYGLDDQVIEVRSPAEAKDFSSNLFVQTSSGAHPASCPVGTGGPSLGVRCGQGVTLTTHPHLVPSWMTRSYTSSPSLCIHRCIVGLLYC
jgi:hypothetical protein